MHVLTKIFIVLVSLLAVFLVPLVVVYAHNENSYKAMYQRSSSQEMVAKELANSRSAQFAAAEVRLNAQLDELRRESAANLAARNAALAEIRQLEARLASAESGRAATQAELQRIAATVESATQLTASLVEELRVVRRDFMVAEQQKVQLDEALRDAQSQLEVAIAARRALQEELQRMNEQLAQTRSRVSDYVARFGTLSDAPVALGITPDRNLTTTILNVRRSADQVLAEINAGSRDGVKEGWTMTIGRGAEFLGNLRIISVDINRATGVVTLEHPSRGLVDIGDIVQSYAGRD
ncbi:MAG TPA: hypothetical protein PK400_06550 [Phycisphaerales bacterium]|nr:hypothetical protein [Phycisphaerales bacterium]HRQ75647.1 hypothetical protein [Phycisphaerales bacterium]